MAMLWPGRGGPAVDYISRPPSAAWQEERPRGIVILGSTGSIGRNALAVLDACPGFFALKGLACAANVRLLAEQASKYRPPALAVLAEEFAKALLPLLPGDYHPEILVGPEGYRSLASRPDASTVLSAQVGAAGLAGTLAAAMAGKVICLANKESLVLAGELVREVCARTGAVVLPVDSEHNAIFQCLAGRGQHVKRLVLTASGGPFRGRSFTELASVTPEEALRHPSWEMGAKITIDSATLMNKGLEVIEAVHLYGVAVERIRVLVHPVSVVHSMVEFDDGGLLAQMGTADMRLPLAHCMCWPECRSVEVPPLDIVSAGPLAFFEPDTEAFPCLGLARDALGGREGGCVVLNAANEAAVELFLQRACAFTDIPHFIQAALADHAQARSRPSAAELEEADGSGAFAEEVRLMAERIEALDHHARALVAALARDGGYSC